MKKMTSIRTASILRNSKKNKQGRSFFKKIFRLIICLLIILVFIYSAYKYNMIPQNFSPFTYLKSIGVENYFNVEEKKPEDVEAQISKYDFEYKFWALSYANPEVEKSQENNNGMVSNELSDEVNNEEENKEKIRAKSEYIMPVEGKIGSAFGNRTNPIKGGKELHKGIDIEASNGAPIKAFAKGEVTFAGFESSFGNYVKISHEQGISSLYAHCSKLLIKKGQKVIAGEVIAQVGNTGSSIGPHLHFEVSKNNEAVDPLKFFE